MADDTRKAGTPASGGSVKKAAKKKPAAKKATRKKTAKKAGSKKTAAKKAPATSTATAAPESASGSPSTATSAPRPTPVPSAASYATDDIESAKSGFLPLWGPLTMLIFVVLIFHYMGDDESERRRSPDSELAARAVAMEPEVDPQIAIVEPVVEEAAVGSGAGSLTQTDTQATGGNVLEALQSASPDQIAAAIEAAGGVLPESPATAEAAGSRAPGGVPMPEASQNPWAPSAGPDALGGGSAEPPPPPATQQAWAPQQPGYPQPPSQGYPQYGWQPPPQGYAPPAGYPRPVYPQAPQAYPQPYGGAQPYPAPQPYAAQPYGVPQPYGAPQPYPPPQY